MKEQEKGKKYKRKRRTRGPRLLLVVSILLMAVGGFRIGGEYMEQRRNEELARMALRLNVETETGSFSRSVLRSLIAAGLENDAVAGKKSLIGAKPPYVPPVDFDYLREINPEVVAWIRVPGTAIDYPIVHTDNNEKYLTVGFDGRPSSAGAVYLDCDSEADMSGRHNLLYGHHMRNGSMFADVVNYKDKDYFDSHRDLYIYMPDREIHLQAVAALYTDSGGDKRRTVFGSQEEFDRYVDDMTKGCAFRQLPEESVKRLYSLVTCSYEFDDARTILYAVEADR